MARIKRKTVVAWVSGLLMLVSCARTAVLFLEAMAEVRDERGADSELIEMCASGRARGSSKMRAACLQARADRASPLVLKALVKAISTGLREFRESIATPFGLATFVLFLISSLLLPVVPWVRALLTAWAGDDDELYQDDHRDSDLEHHVVVLAGDASAVPRHGTVKRRMARLLRGSSRVSSHSANRSSGNGHEVFLPFENGFGANVEEL